MKRLILILAVQAIVLLLHPPVRAEVEVPQSVVGCGCGSLSGPGYLVSGSTLGQAGIGVMNSPSYICHAGFWHPAWLLTPVEMEEIVRPLEYRLGPNHPNPFNPVTTLEFSIPERCRVTMKLYDVNGREAMTVVEDDLDPGRHTCVLRADGLASGVYFCRMAAGPFVETRKLVLLK